MFAAILPFLIAYAGFVFGQKQKVHEFNLNYRYTSIEYKRQASARLIACWADARNLIVLIFHTWALMAELNQQLASNVIDEATYDERIEPYTTRLADNQRDLDRLYGNAHYYIGEFALYTDDEELTVDLIQYNDAFFKPEHRWIEISYDDANGYIEQIRNYGFGLVSRMRTDIDTFSRKGLNRQNTEMTVLTNKYIASEEEWQIWPWWKKSLYVLTR